jgi:hypothetical protein
MVGSTQCNAPSVASDFRCFLPAFPVRTVARHF